MTDMWNIIRKTKHPLKGTQYTISGYSVACRHTMIIVNELNIAFDCGVSTDQTPTHIFISHTHLDHVSCAMNYLLDPPPHKIPIIIMPKTCEQNFKNFVSSAVRMTKGDMIKYKPVEFPVVTVSIGKDCDSVFLEEMKIKNKNFRVECIKCTHTVPTTGYGFTEIRKKLNEEYKKLPQNEIDNLIRTEPPETIFHDEEYPLFVYIGDTDSNVLTNDGMEEILTKYQTIIIECTYLISEHKKLAKKNKHMHWENLRPFVKKHSNIQFILYHFSMSYSAEFVEKYFETVREVDGICNINLLLNDFKK